jgi:hypothetical protein
MSQLQRGCAVAAAEFALQHEATSPGEDASAFEALFDLARGHRVVLSGRAKIVYTAALEHVTAYDRAVVTVVLRDHAGMSTSVLQRLQQAVARPDGDLVKTLVEMLRLQVVPEEKGVRAVVAAIESAKLFRAERKDDVNHMAITVQRFRYARDQAQAMAETAAVSTDLALTYYDSIVALIADLLLPSDVTGKELLKMIEHRALIHELDIFDRNAVDAVVDSTVVVVERHRGLHRLKRDGQKLQPDGKALADAKLAEIQAAAATKAKVKADAEARAAVSAAAAAAAATATAAAAVVVRGNLAKAFSGTCYNCGKVGHKQADCPAPPPKP